MIPPQPLYHPPITIPPQTTPRRAPVTQPDLISRQPDPKPPVSTTRTRPVRRRDENDQETTLPPPISSTSSNPPTAPPRSAASHLDMPVDPNEPTYCTCQQVSYGEMIACDNENCEIEWFHYNCVGLSGPPRGKWYAPLSFLFYFIGKVLSELRCQEIR